MFHKKHYSKKTDIVRYYFITNLTVLKLCLQKYEYATVQVLVECTKTEIRKTVVIQQFRTEILLEWNTIEFAE